MQLRDYQLLAFKNVTDSFKKGNKRVLLESPCGSGKTVIATYMAQQSVKAGKTVWIILPRQEIMDQTFNTFKNCGVSTDGVYIGMVQTTANHIDELPKPDLILYDECHISVANTYWKISNAFPDAWIVGLTASPCRTDNRPLGDLYQDIVKGVSVKWLIENKFLAPYEYYSVPIIDTGEEVDNQSSSYDEILSKPAVYSDVLRSYERFAKGLPTVVYCTSIKHSKSTCDYFNSKGYISVHLDGNTPSEERRKAVAMFREGEIDILCNCDLISMGFDMPDIGCVMLLRPTNSTALHIQQSGRALRYKPGKTAIIIDCVGNYLRHGMPDDDRDWSLTEPVKKRKLLDNEGNYPIRRCPECFLTFKTAPICPYCGAEYPLSPRELKAHSEIELKRITQEEMERVNAEKKKARMEVGRAKTYGELVAIGRKRGYDNPTGWAYMIMKGRKR